MVRPIDRISVDPGGEQLSIARLSSGQFSQLAQEHLIQINKAKQRLEQICFLFGGKGTILPIHCKEATNALDELNDHVAMFCKLLDETSRLPIIFTALRYELMYGLYLIKEQVDVLEDLINSYRVICMSSSPSLQRKHIYEAFQTIFQQISDTSQHMKFQSEAARFKERELISLFENA